MSWCSFEYTGDWGFGCGVLLGFGAVKQGWGADWRRIWVAALRWVSACAGVVGLSLRMSDKRAAARARDSGSMMARRASAIFLSASTACLNDSDSRIVASWERES